jgi:hypothetical protein
MRGSSRFAPLSGRPAPQEISFNALQAGTHQTVEVGHPRLTTGRFSVDRSFAVIQLKALWRCSPLLLDERRSSMFSPWALLSPLPTLPGTLCSRNLLRMTCIVAVPKLHLSVKPARAPRLTIRSLAQSHDRCLNAVRKISQVNLYNALKFWD